MMIREAIERDEFRTPTSPEGLQVMQITSDDERPSQSFYLDTPSWTSDSMRLLFPREPSKDGGKKGGYWLCDCDDGFSIRPLVEYDRRVVYQQPKPESGTYGCVLAPAGDCVYHFVRRAEMIEAHRVDLASGERALVCAAPAPYETYNLFSVSADGERVVLGCFLGDGETEGAPWGAYVFELTKGTHRIIEFGNGFHNMHCQYSHDPDPAFSHDVLLQATKPRCADGSWMTPPNGYWPSVRDPDDNGIALFVVRDDGEDWRFVPVGRDPGQRNQGHQTWRGREYSVVTSAYELTPERWRAPLLEATPLPCGDEKERWLGRNHPDGRLVDLSRRMARADSCHFGFDASGRHFVSDTDGYTESKFCFLYVGTYVESEDGDPYVKTRYLLMPRSEWGVHGGIDPHAFLSPDGRYATFMSAFTGRSQVYVAYGFEYP